jgi:hypothetical protein
MRVFLAACAAAAFSVAVAATGCDDNYSPGAESGGSKGPEIESAGQTGQPVSGSASQQAQSTAPPGFMPMTGANNVDAGTNVDATTDQ